MIPSPVNPLEKVVVGNDAGWLLHFKNEEGEKVIEIGRDEYYAEIQASLPSGLGGGVYTFVIEGLTDEHYAMITQTQNRQQRAVNVDLYLYWRDTASSVIGYLKNLSGLTDTAGSVSHSQLTDFLVARLAVTAVTRKAGARKYETRIKAEEKVHFRARKRLLCSPVQMQGPLDAARAAAEEAGIEVVTYPLQNQTSADPNAETNQQVQNERGRTVLNTLQDIAGRIEHITNQHGRGMLLVRDGVLHVGQRPILSPDRRKYPLYAGNGLIEIEVLGTEQVDPNFNSCEQQGEPPERLQVKLTLKGRPDLKPGDVVEFDPPQGDMSVTQAGLAGAVGDVIGAISSGNLLPSLGSDELSENKVTLYVNSVEHKLSRTSSFITTVTGVSIAEHFVWDEHTRGCPTRPSEPPREASPELRIARAQQRSSQRIMEGFSFSEVAEVRAMKTTGSEEPPSQTLTLWRGLVADDGGRNQARRLDIERPTDAEAQGTPYATPFAWGRCGLVLPRYPGTRVLVTHRKAHRADPVDIGAIWPSGEGPDSEAGDWWLILPVGVAEAQRQSSTGDGAVEGHAGKATNDLIDADGNRVVEVGSFTLRFVSDNLSNAGTRPSAAQPDSVTIEHAAGDCSIVMTKDGNIEISGANITLDAGSGEIKLKAGAVKVE